MEGLVWVRPSVNESLRSMEAKWESLIVVVITAILQMSLDALAMLLMPVVSVWPCKMQEEIIVGAHAMCDADTLFCRMRNASWGVMPIVIGHNQWLTCC